MTNEIPFQNRMLLTKELAELVIYSRNQKGWTQDILAEVTKLSLRTIQRVEKGEPSSLDTRRALAIGFELDDIDHFNKPMSLPDFEKIRQNQEKLDSETVTKSLEIICSGRLLREIIESCDAFAFHQLTELPQDVEQIYADLQDYIRDYRDVHSEYSANLKLEVNKDLERLIDDIIKNDFTIGFYTRRFIKETQTENYEFHSFHLVIGPIATFPEVVRVPKRVQLA
jgi:transcriptional regulator with XRE-family HTH domain